MIVINIKKDLVPVINKIKKTNIKRMQQLFAFKLFYIKINRETVLLDQSLLDYSQEDARSLTQMAQEYGDAASGDKHAALLTYYSSSAAVKIPAVW